MSNGPAPDTSHLFFLHVEFDAQKQELKFNHNIGDEIAFRGVLMSVLALFEEKTREGKRKAPPAIVIPNLKPM